MENNPTSIPEQKQYIEPVQQPVQTPVYGSVPSAQLTNTSQKGPVRPITAIIISIVFVFILIIVIALATIGISMKKEGSETKTTTKQSLADRQSQPAEAVEGFTASGIKPDVLFRGATYRFVFHDSKEEYERYQFMKPGDTHDSWSELVTILKYFDTPATLNNLDLIALGEKNYVEDEGGYVLEARTIKNTGSRTSASSSPSNYLVASYRYPEDDQVELTFTLFYIENNDIFADWYAVKFTGDTIDEAGTKAKEFLSAHKEEIQAQLETHTVGKAYWIK